MEGLLLSLLLDFCILWASAYILLHGLNNPFKVNETLSHFLVNKNLKNNLFFPLGLCHIKSTWFQNLCWNRLRATETSPYFSNCLVCLPVLWEVNVVWASYSFSRSRVDIQGLLGSLSLVCFQYRASCSRITFSGLKITSLDYEAKGWE